MPFRFKRFWTMPGTPLRIHPMDSNMSLRRSSSFDLEWSIKRCYTSANAIGLRNTIPEFQKQYRTSLLLFKETCRIKTLCNSCVWIPAHHLASFEYGLHIIPRASSTTWKVPLKERFLRALILLREFNVISRNWKCNWVLLSRLLFGVHNHFELICLRNNETSQLV